MYSISRVDGFGNTTGRVLTGGEKAAAGEKVAPGEVGTLLEGEEQTDAALSSERVRPLFEPERGRVSAISSVVLVVMVFRHVCFSTGDGSCDTDMCLVVLVTVPALGFRRSSDFSLRILPRVPGTRGEGSGGNGWVGDDTSAGEDFSFWSALGLCGGRGGGSLGQPKDWYPKRLVADIRHTHATN